MTISIPVHTGESMMPQILVVDDEPRHCNSLREFLTQAGYQVHIAGSAEQACELAAGAPMNAILLDIRLPGMDGLSAVERLRQLAPDAPVIIMTAFGTLETASNAVKAGVFEYLVKPFSLKDLKSVLSRALEPKPARTLVAHAQSRAAGTELVIGRSPVMQRIFNLAALAAASDVPVLLTGESGTGKEILARAIHRYSARASNRFLPVFLAALSPNLIESELFGHAKGSYTGAEQHRPGLLEQAHEGTVLLDELGDIPLPLQVKLLRAIEQQEVTRVGEDISRPVRVRFIAATNKSLPDLIAKGQFREDLFYRLSVYHIELPPLRDRREDIPELAHYFLQRVSALNRATDFTPAAMAELQSREWVGNIRELRNAVEHAAVVSRGAPIAVEHLPHSSPARLQSDAIPDWKSLLGGWLDRQLASLDPFSDRAAIHETLMQEIEPSLIELVLARCRQNQSAASRILGLDPKTMRTKLQLPGREKP